MDKPFHLAFPIKDIETTKSFYSNFLGCDIGREDKKWIDFNFFGHQLVCHLSNVANTQIKNPVDQHDVPVPHFGVVLDWDVFFKFTKELELKGIEFIIEPNIRFKGQIGEQATAFLKDPSGNAIEFKSFKDLKSLFRND